MNWWTSDERVETFILNENKRNLNKQSNQVFSPFRYCIFLFCLFCFYWDSDSERFSCETLAPLFENANGIMYKSIREIRRWFPNKIKSQEKNNNNKRILSLSISFFFFSYCCCCYCGCYVSDHRAMVLAGWEREKKESRELHRLLLSYCWLLKNVNLDEQDLSSSKVPMHKSTKVFLSLYRSFTLIESTSSSTQHPTIQTIQTWNFVACPPPLSSSSSCFGYSMRRVGWCPSRILSRAFIFFIFFF